MLTLGERNSVFRRLWRSITRDPSKEKFSTRVVNSPMEYLYRDEQVPIDIFLSVVDHPRAIFWRVYLLFLNVRKTYVMRNIVVSSSPTSIIHHMRLLIANRGSLRRRTACPVPHVIFSLTERIFRGRFSDFNIVKNVLSLTVVK